jgi:D-amino peptidase
MKVFISADIEGVSGTTTWNEATDSHPAYREFQEQMTREVIAACEGALEAGATEITIKDAHAGANNLIARELPPQTKLVRNWSGHPFCMVQELDETFDCAMFIGYHARAGAGGNPLSHTLSSSRVHQMFINDRATSEFYIHYLAAGLVKVPVVMLSGDETICREVQKTDPGIFIAPVKDAIGPSTINLHPDAAVSLIREKAQAAVSGCASIKPATVPEHSTLKIVFKEQTEAYKKSQYPGARLIEPYIVELTVDDYFEVLRALMFLV